MVLVAYIVFSLLAMSVAREAYIQYLPAFYHELWLVLLILVFVAWPLIISALTLDVVVFNFKRRVKQ